MTILESATMLMYAVLLNTLIPRILYVSVTSARSTLLLADGIQTKKYAKILLVGALSTKDAANY